MGADIIAVVFAVVVIGGMGSILGSILTGFVARRGRGPDQGVLSRGVQHGRVRHHGDRAADPALRPVRQGHVTVSLEAAAPEADVSARNRRANAIAFAVMAGADRDRAVRRLSVLRHAGALLRAVRLRLQSADRLRRPAVARPRDVPRAGELRLRPRRQGLGARAGLGDRAGGRGFGRARPRHRGAFDPLERHLFRHDHRRLLADGLFLLRRGAVHPRRGRHPVGAAGTGARIHRSFEPLDPLRLRRSRLPVRLSLRLCGSSTRRSARS